LDEDNLYLDLEAALTAVQKVGQATGCPIGVTPKTLAKRLHERGFLASTEQAHGELRVRRTLEGRRRRVLHLSSSCITLEESDQSGQSNPLEANNRPRGRISPGTGRVLWPDLEDRDSESGQEIRPGRAEQPSIGRNGRICHDGVTEHGDDLSYATVLEEDTLDRLNQWGAES
jgi:hypothetical protein